MTATSLPKTPLDYMAEGYWQDFLGHRSIAGGIAYEMALRDCELDESLNSLQRVDTLLTQIRRELIRSHTWDEKALLSDERLRNLLVFLAFYAGRVLAQQWQDTPHWYGQFEMRLRYPELPLGVDDFYQHMAVLYSDASANDIKSKKVAPLFFALEPIGMRLFGHIDRQFSAVMGGQVASGLYQAVTELLPSSGMMATKNDVSKKEASTPVNTAINTSPVKSTPINTTLVTEHLNTNQTVVNTAEYIANKQAKAASSSKLSSTAITSHQPTIVEASNNVAATAITTDIVDDNSSSTVLQTASPVLIKEEVINSSPAADLPFQTQTTPLKSVPPTPEVFTQLLTELNEIEVNQTAGHSDYQQACKILDQFEQHIAKQHKPRAQVVFSVSHQAARQQALDLLETSATAGHTAAMLRLAMYELLAEGLTADTEQAKDIGVDWVKQAANQKDSRAQRLLSKMYYQAVGVPQDMNNGKYWLEQAAENGHIEATEVMAQWQQAQSLIITRQQEEHSFKRYQILIAAIVVGALLLIIFV
ncbi:hypothetical protein AOC03_10530 [Psychrobacter urativorans]|uniref:Sel1 repeat family protein n=2 Tax=Psychrobacter urativorans TaxID=45610 RepID=A0A0M4T4D4_9GAMM|nr:hypothetical protein AOC03_10530 [Psychrobacter urativorans]